MRVLVCHNHYQQPGGEDESFAAEAALLEARGHEVVRFTLHNDAIHRMTGAGVALRTIWNQRSCKQLRALIRQHKPAVMHCTNTFPLISPAAYYAAKKEGVAVVQSLRNYRLLCPNAYFLRDNKVCEECLGTRWALPAVKYGCYRQSRAATAVVSGMLGIHRLLKTWTRQVDVYYALTEFSRGKFIEGGFPADKIHVKPNFLYPDPGMGTGKGGYAVFVGRLAPEKGIDTLLDAWTRLAEPIPLKIVGDGPLSERVRAAATADPRICWLGRRTPAQVTEIVGEALCLVMPSIWYEGFPRTIVEAYAKGTPVLASRLGSMAEVVRDGLTGKTFAPGDADDLVAKLLALWRDPDAVAAMRGAARREHELRYTAETNYRMLMEIYRVALGAPDRAEAAVAMAT